ncbi:UBP-type zinc finger domain-containing protein [Nonomuraea sp. LPB2021202275-12-8]|uniref:UBP-type zinc finger domain-containing protein n=1 Tax=Nonomuraea sp. LPB2021202275-12-8 TaxID=3120159 RepID=UPI00300DA646
MTPITDGMETARAGLNGQAPRCEHLGMSPSVERGPPECAGCLALGLHWKRLLTCLSCGWVACSDDSPGGHAKEHYRETDHPVVGALEPEQAWRWCYIHGRAV